MDKEDCGCCGPDCEMCFMTENDNFEEDDPDAQEDNNEG